MSLIKDIQLKEGRSHDFKFGFKIENKMLIILNSEEITSCEGEEGGWEHELMGQILLKPF